MHSKFYILPHFSPSSDVEDKSKIDAHCYCSGLCRKANAIEK